MRGRTYIALAIILASLVSTAVLGSYATRIRMPAPTPPSVLRQTSSSTGTTSVASAPSSPSRPPLEHNAVNTPPVVLNSVNGVTVESQDVKTFNPSAGELNLKIKNVSARPIVQVVFTRRREKVNVLEGSDFSSADFTESIPFQPGAEITYHIALTDFEKPVVARISALVYEDGTAEGDEVLQKQYAMRYMVYNSELATLLSEVREGAARARAAGKSDTDAASDFAETLRQRADATHAEINTTPERKRVYSEFARVIADYAREGKGLSTFADKLSDFLKNRPAKVRQQGAEQ